MKSKLAFLTFFDSTQFHSSSRTNVKSDGWESRMQITCTSRQGTVIFKYNCLFCAIWRHPQARCCSSNNGEWR